MYYLPLLTLLALVLIFTPNEAAEMVEENNRVKGIIGAIVDKTSRVGKEQRVAMEMAVHDFNKYSSNQTRLMVDLQLRNSWRQPVHAALAALDLINSQQVQAILGPQTWEETLLVADIASRNQTPILSFADAIPKWATERFPFLLQSSPNQYAQMKAIAAVVQSWEWHQVTVIHEDIDSSATGIIPHLFEALREVGAEISQVLALPPFISSTLTQELEKLKTSQCRVFIVHLSLPLAEQFFEQAKNMSMMEKDYIWIVTDSFTSLAHSITASSISSSMEGIVGVKGYISGKEQKFQDFYRRFRKRFGSEYPEEDNHEPGALAVQAYDAVASVALAISENKQRNQTLLQRISLSDFDGLTGKAQFNNKNVTPAVYQIINLTGRSYRELGFWTDGLGFSKTIDNSATYNSSMKYLGQVLWPGAPWYEPKGWAIPTDTKPLRIGVPVRSMFKQYVNAEFDELENVTSFHGFSIDLFKETVSKLPFYLPYEFFPYNGSYNDLVKRIHLKEFDAVVGDVAIVVSRLEFAEFTHPYSEAGLVMIVPLEKSANKALLFMKPFTKAMWIIIAIVTIYNGFVVWLIEQNHWHELQGSPLHQTGAFLWLSFSSLFSLHGGTLHSNLSRMTMLVWLFVALVITQTYTANLASMLTVQGFKPATVDIESLQSSNALVGYSNASFVASYLADVLRFNRKNLEGYTSLEDYDKDLKSGKISAIFLEVTVSKIFLAKYCKSFATTGPTYKVGGFGFAFPKGSPLLPSVTEALLKVSESGKLRELETSMIASETCMDVDVDVDDDISSLSPSSFWVLFAISGGTSTIALIVYLSHCNWKLSECLLVNKKFKMLILTLMKQWGIQKQRFYGRLLSHGESPRSSTNTPTEALAGSSIVNIEAAMP
ncbi:hypothetical protein LWI28_007230 [Acer negundo]|uniref:Glutamate receptor n=1 Tax=Acer negundo TaxID=4023 RepID=A0AAD5J516_ACENE|nr:hypothetical protein LWI28_007230 [Acer negundo]